MLKKHLQYYQWIFHLQYKENRKKNNSMKYLQIYNFVPLKI